ncbi:MAG TPA: tRNA pseudouridine(55) synthase TruB [Pirellulaceae bacterium]|nr:tRNA pseudouridine(55) synthase TruB [Pirellulaceae bacterium]
MLGFLNVDKPSGVTSRDVVNVVQRALRPLKVGHAGTLDPLATGVLVVAVGPMTRLIDRVQAQGKTYVAEFRLGWSSDTDDLEGALTEVPGPLPDRPTLDRALQQFLGEIEQIPPAYSAVKVQGKRAYALAREGRPPDLAPRTVSIRRLSLLDYHAPDLRLEIECGSGTYIRSLARDLGRAVGSAGLMTSLRRTAIGSFRVDDAIPLDRLRGLGRDEFGPLLIDPVRGLPELPTIDLDDDQVARLMMGKRPEIVGPSDGPDQALARNRVGEVVALLVRVDGRWQADKVFPRDSSRRTVAPPIAERSRSAGESPTVSPTASPIALRLAAELHDGLLQEIVGAKMLVESLDGGRAVEPNRLGETLERVASLLDSAARHGRALIRRLDAPAPEDPAAVRREIETGLVAEVARWQVESPEIEVMFELEAWPEDADAIRDWGGIIVEGLRNALRHGQARRVRIESRRGNDRSLVMTIDDDGIGFDPGFGSGGHGLRGMRHRLERLGGSLAIERGAERGTSLRIDLPAAT